MPGNQLFTRKESGKNGSGRQQTEGPDGGRLTPPSTGHLSSQRGQNSPSPSPQSEPKRGSELKAVLFFKKPKSSEQIAPVIITERRLLPPAALPHRPGNPGAGALQANVSEAGEEAQTAALAASSQVPRQLRLQPFQDLTTEPIAHW